MFPTGTPKPPTRNGGDPPSLGSPHAMLRIPRFPAWAYDGRERFLTEQATLPIGGTPELRWGNLKGI